VIQSAEPRRANTAPKIFEVSASTSTMLLVPSDCMNARCNPPQVSLRYTAPSSSAPAAPMPAASVGVAMPARIEPRVAATRPASGTTPATKARSATHTEDARSSLGSTGPSFGLRKLRTAT
jgi:hypothetical protein